MNNELLVIHLLQIEKLKVIYSKDQKKGYLPLANY